VCPSQLAPQPLEIIMYKVYFDCCPLECQGICAAWTDGCVCTGNLVGPNCDQEPECVEETQGNTENPLAFGCYNESSAKIDGSSGTEFSLISLTNTVNLNVTGTFVEGFVLCG
jgi:hypothetical protein